MTIKKLEVFVIVTIIAVFGIIYAFTVKPDNLAVRPQTSTNVDTNSDSAVPMTGTSVRPGYGTNDQPVQPAPSTTIEYKGVDGKNALDLLKENHQVEAIHYSYGDLVTSIDGIKPDSQHFWAMYVNGQFSQVGASAYITKSTDNIKWEVDAVVDTTK